MDHERDRIQADLRGLIDGEVRCDDVFLQLYASDASIYEVKPLGIVRPRHVSDVVACVRYAAEQEIPIHARGAGTGLAGESLGPGLVMDFSYAMRRVIHIGEEQVRLQPGVVHSQLDRQLAENGRLFGPDPATGTVSTIGGVLARDGSGSRWLRYGSARNQVESLQLVLADGEVIEAGRHRVDQERQAAQAGDEQPSRRAELVSRLADLLDRQAPLIAEHKPQSCVNTCGYQLDGVLEGGYLNLARLVAGSEGTLGLITEATVRTHPQPRHTGVALLFFDRLESAAHGALVVTRMGVSACDLMDRRSMSLARESDPQFSQLLPREAEAMLLVEFQGDDADEIRDRLQRVVHRLQRRKRLAFHSCTAQESEDIELYWRLANRVVPTLYRLKGTTRPLPLVEDIAIPPAALPDFLVRLQNVLKNHQVTASLFAHAGHGQLHIRPFLDLANPLDVRKMQALASDLYQEVLDVHGTISGEHGQGLSRTWFVQRQYGPLYEVFREVKRIFDPQNVFNPGKIIANVPQPLTKNLRPVSAPVPRTEPTESPATLEHVTDPALAIADSAPLRPRLSWSVDEIAYTARMCNGCGRCRTQSDDERMCPIFRFAPREEASPRAKANLMRAVMTGRLEPEEVAGEAVKAIADLCVNCHQCRLECPAGVDIPKLMIECKAQYVATNGLRSVEWICGNLDRLASWASWITPLVNWGLANRQVRCLLERVSGIAQGRKLPRLAARSFLRLAPRHGLTRPTRSSGRKVVYFVDLYANWFDVQLAEAVVAVLEHNGVAVFVPPSQAPSGMALISQGAVDSAKRQASRNAALLADAVRHGYHIVASEPAAALCLTHEYPQMLADDDARLVAENTSEVCTYLWRMHQQGQLELDLKPVNATLGYHEPCHIRALGSDEPGRRLLQLVPGLSVEQIDQGCSGMAGTFGLKRANYRSSLRAGWGLISALRSPKLQLGTSECSACKMQMEQGTSKPTIHPLKVLALAYGLKPEYAQLLTARGEELVVT